MQVSDPIHLPCPDMAGMVDPDPEKVKRSLLQIQKIREKYGWNKRKPKRQLNVNTLEWRNR
ncbi:hypothetical protein [Vibrio tetraodonis]|uniref:hypothetical protein n=1 Tax=Vibrio tetraodonis TaxID=2231647 RepID=UPI000E0BDBD3|nr:hypothetical protein [Vibrio tetraodonis]